MTQSAGKPGDVVLVTGAGMGLGLEIALTLAGRGFTVYATVPNLGQRAGVYEEAVRRNVTVQVLQLDVTDAASITSAVDEIIDASGNIYALVNNAGIGLRGCIEDLTEEEIRRVVETNILGTFAVTQRVLPHLRAAGRGRIVTISSVGGRIATFGLSAYCATKFAQEGFGEALALDIAPFGLQSILIEPGIVKTTRWTENRGIAQGALDPAGPYFELFQRAEALADERVEKVGTTPADVSRTVHHALTVRKPRLRYVVGRPATAMIMLRRYLPAPVFDHLYFGLLLRRIMRDEPARSDPVANDLPA